MKKSNEKEKLLEKFKNLKYLEKKEVLKENSNCLYCFNCSYCSDCSDCSDCSYCSYCSYCLYCSNCSECSNCSDCSDCFYCSNLAQGILCKGLKFSSRSWSKYWVLNKEVSKAEFERVKEIMK